MLTVLRQSKNQLDYKIDSTVRILSFVCYERTGVVVGWVQSTQYRLHMLGFT